MRELLERLADHPVVDVSAPVSRRIHARARAIFLARSRLAGRPRLAAFERSWAAWVEPVAVTALGGAQLVWVFETVRRLVG